MSAPSHILTTDLGSRLCELASTAERSLHLVAPFIKARQLEAVLRCVPDGVAVTAVTRWRPDEVAAGVSDLEALDVCREHGAELRLLDRLHAKLFVADGRQTLLGSANLTGRGLGTVSAPNLEILLPCLPSVRSTTMFLARLRLESRPATSSEKDAVAVLSALIPPPAPTRAGMAETQETPWWLPTFRSPDRLFDVYRSLSDEDVPDGDVAAIDDLAVLDLPFDLDRGAFEAAARSRLRAEPAVHDLDVLLSQPRRFGEVSAWVSRIRSGCSRQESQRTAQTVMRWLTYFDPGRYRIDAPRYSEILSLVERGDANGRHHGQD